MTAILLVCTANICRSPMAEAVLRQKLAAQGGELFKVVQSAGVHAHPRRGEPIDKRAAAALERRDYKLDKRWRTRRVDPADFGRFDLIVAMEQANLDALRELCPAEHQAKLRLLLDFVPGHEGQDLPDPYFGPAQGFDAVLALIERAVDGVIAWRRASAPAR